MRKWKKILAFALTVVLTTSILSNITIAADSTDTGDRLSYDGVKYKTAQTAISNDVFKDARKGLLLYSYGSETTATFRETFSGEFEIEAKAVGKKTVPVLSTYTLHFTSMTTGESFAVAINDSGTSLSAYVVVEDDATGIYYETTYDDKPHGYTTVKNQNNSYTVVPGANTTTIVFDPQTMEIKIKNVGGQEEYKTIWCLTEEVMDGKRFEHVLEPFDYYSVSVEFTSVGAGKKGELLIYNVNGEDYGEANLPYVEPMINSNLVLHALVGKKYTLPSASIYGISEEGDAEDVGCTIFNSNGKELASGKIIEGVSFVPEKADTYYLYYTVSDQAGTGTYAKLMAYAPETVACTLETYDGLPESVGVNATVKIPARTAESALFFEGSAIYTDITVKYGDEIVEEKESVKKGFNFTFEKQGTYTIVWSTKIYDHVYEDTVAINVDEHIPSIVGAELKKAYDKDVELNVPEATVYVDGKNYETNMQVVKPSGKVIEDEKLTLDEVGNYRVVYTYTVQDKKQEFERTFSVDYNSDNLFVAGEKTEIYYDDAAGNADMPGVQIEMTSKDSSATYAKTLDLSDNTKLDTLLELYVIPSTIGSADMTGFYVTLTDKLNPENCITIRIVGGDGNMSSGCYIRAKATGQSGYVGLYKNHSWDQEPYTWEDSLENTMYHDKGGYTIPLDLAFAQTVFDLQEKTLVLRYDASEKALYSQQRVKLVHDETYRENLVVDFDDPEMFQNLWAGFTDDSQVEMSITPLSVSGTATFKIMNVDGIDLQSKNLADTTAPDIAIDFLDMEKVPDGKVGLAYPIFDIVANDNLCSEESLKVTTTVTYEGTEVAVSENAFTPEETGIYTIHYHVSDGFGNVAEEVVEVTVKSDVPSVSIAMQETLPEKLTYGMKYYAPKFYGEGGSGKHTYKTYYVHDNEKTEFTGNFIPMDDGDFTVVCEVQDYLGQTAKVSKDYHIEFTPEILIEETEIVLPFVLLADKQFEFEKYVATYYKKLGEKAKKADCVIEVTDAEGTRILKNRMYTPKASDNVKEATIRFLFEEKVEGKTIKKEIVRKIPLHTIGNTDKFIEDYFIGTNAQFEAYNRYMTISAANTSSNMNMQFVRPVNVRNFSLVLKASENGEGGFRSAYECIRVTLTDKDNPNVKVQFDIIQNGDKLGLSINGEKSVLMPGTLTTKTQANVVLSYNNDSFTVYGVENAMLGNVKNALTGETFNGFESNEAYLTIEILGVKGDTAIDLISINNQTFLSSVQDSTNPELFVNGSYSGVYVTGDEVSLPTAEAYDVLNYVSQPTITVIAPDGSEVKASDGTILKNAPANKEYLITVEQFGQYTVTYTAIDEAGRTTNASKTLGVYDNVLPTVKLKGKLLKSVRAGKTVKLKKYTVEDNGNVDNVQVTVYCGTPSGNLIAVKDNKILTEEAGTYYVYFYLIDENGNSNVQTFSFEAK